MSKITSNPPETVPWSEYRIMVDQRDSFRQQMLDAQSDAKGIAAALFQLQLLIAEDDLPADARSSRYEQLQEYRERLRGEGYDPGPSPVEGVE